MHHQEQEVCSILFYVEMLHFYPPTMIAIVSLGSMKRRIFRNQDISNLCKIVYGGIACIFQGTDLYPQLHNLLFSVSYDILDSIFRNIILLITPPFFSHFLTLTNLEYRKRQHIKNCAIESVILKELLPISFRLQLGISKKFFVTLAYLSSYQNRKCSHHLHISWAFAKYTFLLEQNILVLIIFNCQQF